MTYSEFIEQIGKLETNINYPYVPSTTSKEHKSYKLISVSEDTIIVKRDDDEIKVSIQQIKEILANLKKDTPLDIERLLGASGNTRSIIESLLCLTPTIFYTKVNRRKNIYDSSKTKHNLGELCEFSLEYTVEKLGSILKDMYANADENFQVAAIHMFGIEYAQHILEKKISTSEIIRASGLKESYATELAKGINIYKCLTSEKYDLQYRNLVSSNKEYGTFNLSTKIPFDISSFSTSQIALRYTASLLAKPFTILTGNSGAGKTRIATQLASWLIKTTDSGLTNSLVVPVGADWTDNTKILGYFNPLANNGTGDFIKSDVLNFIGLAKDNPKIPFFLILDEMNLSHVERYFSDFLSAMESGKPILLYKKPENCESTVEETITLPKNLFVTGTVNIDETTYMFSPKVLDRANVIEFSPEREDVLKIFSHKPEVQEIQPAPAGMAEAFVELAEKVHNFENGPLTDAGADLDGIFGNLYDILKPSGFEFAYRTTKEIVLYYCAVKSINDELTTLEIIDHQIVQKILPKIHGNKKQIGELLNKLKEFLSKYEELELSQKKVSSMIDKLEKYQYASFI